VASDLKDRIRAIRQRLPGKPSQAELARRIGVAPQAVNQWENGRAVPPMGRLLRLADVAGVGVEVFAQGGPDPETVPLATVTGVTEHRSGQWDPQMTLEDLTERLVAEWEAGVQTTHSLRLGIFFAYQLGASGAAASRAPARITTRAPAPAADGQVEAAQQVTDQPPHTPGQEGTPA